jgi:hypothetical protein
VTSAKITCAKVSFPVLHAEQSACKIAVALNLLMVYSGTDELRLNPLCAADEVFQDFSGAVKIERNSLKEDKAIVASMRTDNKTATFSLSLAGKIKTEARSYHNTELLAWVPALCLAGMMLMQKARGTPHFENARAV